MKEAYQFRNACFTLNNYTEEEVEHLKLIDVQYIIFAKEVAPTTGTPHLQGYVELKRRLVLSKLKELLTGDPNHGIHLERRIGTQTSAIGYCRGGEEWEKPLNDNVHEHGERRTQGKDEVQKALMLHEDDASIEVAIGELTTKEIKAYELCERYIRSPNRGSVKVYWIWGDPGVGKTRYCNAMADEHLLYVPRFGIDGFWERYNKQRVILFDDLDVKKNGEEMDQVWFRALLHLIDIYPIQVNKKFGSSWLYAEEIYITAQEPPWGPSYWPIKKGNTIVNMFHVPTIEEVKSNVELAQVMRRLYEVRRIERKSGEEMHMPTVLV